MAGTSPTYQLSSDLSRETNVAVLEQGLISTTAYCSIIFSREVCCFFLNQCKWMFKKYERAQETFT